MEFSLRHIISLRSFLGRCLFAVLCMATLTACVYDDGPFADDPDEGGLSKGDVWVAFKISNATAIQQSRVSDSQNHPEELATNAENHINPSDFTVIIMDSQNRLLKVVEDIVVDEIPNTSGSQYTVSGKVNSDYLEIIGEGNSFGILCIANSQGTGGGDTFTMNLWANSLKEISAKLKTYRYTPAEGIAWLPDMTTNFIPMAGYKRVAALASTSGHQTPATALQLGSISMQRAMAKLRILDGFKYQGLPYDMRIVSVKMHNSPDRGAILPDVTQTPAWANGTTVVEKAAAPTPYHAWRYASQEVTFTAEPGFVANGITYDSFYAYVPEQVLQGPTLAPYLTIVTERTNSDGSKIFNEHNVELASIVKPVDGDVSLARNHIYHFVTTIVPPYIQLSPLVYPWETERHELNDWEEIK